MYICSNKYITKHKITVMCEKKRTAKKMKTCLFLLFDWISSYCNDILFIFEWKVLYFVVL